MSRAHRPHLFALLPLLALHHCGTAPPPRSPAVLLALEVGPGTSLPRDRTPRVPRITLQFDRPLAEPTADALWIVRGEASATLRTAAARGVLGPNEAPRRVPARVRFQLGEPERVVLEALEPLQPDESFVVAVTARLRTREGAPVEAAAGHPGAWLEPLRVDSPPGCETLATLALPPREDAPRTLPRALVQFNRPVHPAPGALGPPARLFDRGGEGDPVPCAAVLDCEVPGRGFGCLSLRVDAVLESGSPYGVLLGELVDEGGRAPGAAGLTFRTGESVNAAGVRADAAVACAADETARAPFCVRAVMSGLVLRGATDGPGLLELRARGRWAASPVGLAHAVRLDGFEPSEALALEVWARDEGGVIGARYDVGAFTVPALPALRITEVLARPLGPASQEFVEVINDGGAPVSTAGLVLTTPAGSSALPDDGIVPPGARAILVGRSYDPRGDGEGDAAPAPGTVVLQLHGALAGRGLADRGADVSLAGPAGELISRAPTGDPALAPLAGVSVVRADGRIREDDPAAWSYDAASGSTPGLPDRVR